MNCALCRPLLSKYVDGEARPAERAQVEAHIGACPACRRLLAQYQILRAHVANLPNYQPDPRLRARVFASLDRLERGADEVPITRRVVGPAVRPARSAPFGARRLFGQMATGFASLLVIATSVLVWQLISNGPGVARATPLPTPDATGKLPLSVPTAMVGLPPPQETQIPVMPSLVSAGGHAASPTATFWSPADDGATMHMVRDESYGYELKYPPKWWTASAVSLTGLLAHRILRPWGAQDSDTPTATLSVDVLANPGGRPPADAAAQARLLVAWGEPAGPISPLTTPVAGLDGFSVSSDSGARHRQATFLFAGALVYRLAFTTLRPPRPSSASPYPTADAVDPMDAVLRSFRLTGNGAVGSAGARPLLFLHNGDLWQADPTGSGLRAITYQGRVRDFALAPDLTHVALLIADRSGPAAQAIEVRSLQDGQSVRVWQADAIQAVAWYGDHELLAIGGTPGGGQPLGVYRLAAAGGSALLRLADLSTLPDGGVSARDLQVSPDRLLVSYLAMGRNGPDLYGVRADGSYGRSLLPNTALRPVVTGYTWLPPTDADAASRLLLLAGGQLSQLTLTPGTLESALAELPGLPAATFQDLAVAPDGAVAALAQSAGAAGQIYVLPAPAAPAAVLMPLGSHAPATGSLAWSGNGRYLLFAEPAAKGAEHMLMVDTRDSSLRPLGDAGPRTMP